MSSATGRGSANSSAATPAQWSAVTLRMQLPDVWMACISTLARSANRSGVLQLRPVELDVLARCEVTVTFVVLFGNVGQGAHLAGIKRAVGNSNPQHVAVQLQVKSVHEAERLELFFCELADQPPLRLPAELLDPLVDKGLIEFIVTVHNALPLRWHQM